MHNLQKCADMLTLPGKKPCESKVFLCFMSKIWRYFAIRHRIFATCHRNIDIFDIRVTMQISGKETYFCVLRRF